MGPRSPAQASSSRGASVPGSLRSSSYTQGSSMRLMLGVDVAPPGCAPDAYKLFVGNLPRAYTEHDLLPVSKHAVCRQHMCHAVGCTTASPDVSFTLCLKAVVSKRYMPRWLLSALRC